MIPKDTNSIIIFISLTIIAGLNRAIFQSTHISSTEHMHISCVIMKHTNLHTQNCINKLISIKRASLIMTTLQSNPLIST